MKKIAGLIIAVLTSTLSLFAQSNGVGFTNIDAIVFNMPDIEKINADLDTYRTVLSNRVATKTEQFNLFVEAFQKMKENPASSDSLIQVKQIELVTRQTEVQNYKTEQEQIYANKQAELFQPVYGKVQKAIEEVRADKGLGIILNSQAGANANIILAFGEGNDITKAVFEKLGVPFPAPAEPTADPGKN